MPLLDWGEVGRGRVWAQKLGLCGAPSPPCCVGTTRRVRKAAPAWPLRSLTRLPWVQCVSFFLPCRSAHVSTDPLSAAL